MLETFTIINKTKGKLPSLPFVPIKNAILGKEYDLSIACVSPLQSRKLNRSFRKIDSPTNILSFPLSKTSGEIVFQLDKVRKDLIKFTKEFHKDPKSDGVKLAQAWRELYTAEGSDWNWWYGGKAHTGGDNPFDALYRTHLKNVYKFLKKPVPDFLKISIA
jgi:hypothetical protein